MCVPGTGELIFFFFNELPMKDWKEPLVTDSRC